MAKISNPPYPHSVVITRVEESGTPLSPISTINTIYDGMCDFENNKYPHQKNGVLVGKYTLYIPDRITFVIGDKIAFTMGGRLSYGILQDFTITNFGTRIYWDFVNN